ncbi:MAG: DNA internalization-related competence protein ComEC/Rec2 [Gammaproteobacteria bacterium]|nr:MAG: DNA internalization-related competence protein ComEC/Rec2 [Gammaproteobacteria bacterium]
MDKWLLLFFLGAILSLFLPIVPALFYIVLLLSLAAALIFTKKLTYISGFLLGSAWILFNGFTYQHSFTANQLDKNNLHRSTHFIEGEILTLQNDELQKINKAILTTNHQYDPIKPQRFNIKITYFDYIKMSHPFVVRLNCKVSCLRIKQGFKVRLKVRLKPAHGFANKGAFNYQVWLRYKNIVATGYVVKSKSNNVIALEPSFRQKRYDQLMKILSTKTSSSSPLSSLVFALTLGERSNISVQQWQVLKATGTQHLIAISGLHLGLVASGMFVLALFILRYLPLSWFNTLQNSNYIQKGNLIYIAITLSLCITLYYAALAGFAIPTLRALVMLVFYWLARLLAIKLTLKRWLLLVVFWVLLTSPMSILSASFWLSFYAVSVIFLLLWRCFSIINSTKTSHKTIYKIITFFKALIILQLGLSVLLLPITLLFYQQFSVLAFAANVIAVPWMSFTAIPLSLLAVIVLPFSGSLASYILDLCLQFLAWLWQWLSFLAQQEWALQTLTNGQVLLAILLVFALFSYYFLRLKRQYYLYFLPIVGVILINAFATQNKWWQVTVLDVGHGLAVIIERAGHVIVYDTGANYPSGFNFADAAILPYLQQRNIKQIDKVIISHNDNDHLGGLAVLAQKIPISSIMFNEPNVIVEMGGGEHNNNVLNNNVFSNTQQQTCLQGQRFSWQGLTFEQLWPTLIQGDHNDDSCVIRISDGNTSILFTGDASKKVERQLLKMGLIEQTDVIIAPHHGSKSASSAKFLQTLQPQYAIFSSGYLNRWHMPVNKVLLTYHQQGIKTYNTADVGMVEIKFLDDVIKLSTYRNDHLNYWFAN